MQCYNDVPQCYYNVPQCYNNVPPCYNNVPQRYNNVPQWYNNMPVLQQCATVLQQCDTVVQQCSTVVQQCATVVQQCATVVQQCATGLHQNVKPALPYPTACRQTYRFALPYLPNMSTPTRFLDYRLVCSSNSALDILQLLAGRPIGRGSCAVLTVLFIISEVSTSALRPTQ